jgi:uncharacterized protein (TIGR00369 family)
MSAPIARFPNPRNCRWRCEMARGSLCWTADEVTRFLHTEFPQAYQDGRDYPIRSLEPGRIVLAMTSDERHVRPGGTVSGPSMAGLVDYAMYALLLAHHGAAARLAVTTGMQISFLRRPAPGTMVCALELLKHGRTLSVGDAKIRIEGSNEIVAHAELTYYMGAAGQTG